MSVHPITILLMYIPHRVTKCSCWSHQLQNQIRVQNQRAISPVYFSFCSLLITSMKNFLSFIHKSFAILEVRCRAADACEQAATYQQVSIILRYICTWQDLQACKICVVHPVECYDRPNVVNTLFKENAPCHPSS
jgi:hypothetical protein